MRPIVGLAVTVPLVLAAEQPSHADTILVAGEHGSRAEIAAQLTRLGHDVTVATTVPADLAEYMVVWHTGASALGPAGQDALVAHVDSGGGLLLSGDTGAVGEAHNGAVEAILDRLVATGPVEVSLGPVHGVQWFTDAAYGGISQRPYALERWGADGVGQLVGVPDAHVVTRGDHGHATSAAWASPELLDGAGQLVVLMDGDWFARSHEGPNIIANLARFLVDGPIDPTDGVPELGTSAEPHDNGLSTSGDEEDAPPGGGDDVSVDDAPARASFDGGAAHDPPEGPAPDASDDADLEVGGCAAGGGGGSLLLTLAVAVGVRRRGRADRVA